MNTMRQLSIFVLTALIAGLLVLPAAAQENVTIPEEIVVSVTEDQINEAYALADGYLVQFDNPTVDLTDAGTYIISTMVLPNDSDNVYNVIAEFSPVVENGDAYWVLVSGNVNDFNLSPAQVNYINGVMEASIVREYRTRGEGADYVSIVIANDTLTVTFSGDELESYIEEIKEKIDEFEPRTPEERQQDREERRENRQG